MAGIAGAFLVDRRVRAEKLVASIAASMSHRAGVGTRIAGDAQHAMGLVVGPTDEDCIAPEVLDAGFPLLLAADLRLDSRDDLRRSLDLRADATDADCVRAAYRCWGPRSIEHIEGDFALAVWDPDTRTLVCARDPFGIRPLFVHARPGWGLVFASELTALLAVAEVPRRINEQRVADYLMDCADDRTSTFYRDIVRLNPGHLLQWRDGIATLRPYWNPDPETELRLDTDGDYEERFRNVFSTAVGSRLNGRLPVAVLLSGGIDSSAVAVQAAHLVRRGGGRLRTLSMRYDGAPAGDERTFIEAVVSSGPFAPEWFDLPSERPFRHFTTLLGLFGEPFDNPHLSMGWDFWRFISASGARALLDGVDGDATFSYKSVFISDLVRRGRMWRAFREAVGLARLYCDDAISPFSLLFQEGMRPLLPDPLRRLRVHRAASRWPARDVGLLIRREFGLRMGAAERTWERWRERRALRTPRAHHCAEITHGVLVQAVEQMDRLAATFGLQMRHPFFDRRLVEFAIALPWDQRVRDGWTRSLVRRSLATALPDAVLWRGSKWGPAELYTSLLHRYELAVLDDILFDRGTPFADYVDVTALRTVLARFRARPHFADAYPLSLAAILAMWLQASPVTA